MTFEVACVASGVGCVTSLCIDSEGPRAVVTEQSDQDLSEEAEGKREPTILVLDQDEMNLKVIKQVLSDLYEVETTQSVRDAFSSPMP